MQINWWGWGVGGRKGGTKTYRKEQKYVAKQILKPVSLNLFRSKRFRKPIVILSINLWKNLLSYYKRLGNISCPALLFRSTVAQLNIISSTYQDQSSLLVGVYELFTIRSSKFCRVSLFLIFLAASASICSYSRRTLTLLFCERCEMMRNQNKNTRHWKTLLIFCILRRSLINQT